MFIINCFVFRKPEQERWTWTLTDGEAFSEVHFILANNDIKVMDVGVETELNLESHLFAQICF